MIIVIALYVLLWFLNTTAAGYVGPPSPGRMQDLINNPYLEPEYFKQFTDHNFLESTSVDLLNKKISALSGRMKKYANQEEAKQAQLKRSREFNRKWREMVKNLPIGDSLKEAKKKKDKEYDKKRREKFKNLPDGDERKEAIRLKRLRANRERRAMLKRLPDDDHRKQNDIKAQKLARQKFALKKILENPKSFQRKNGSVNEPLHNN